MTMNAISNPTLYFESEVYLFSLNHEPDLKKIICSEKYDYTYNGHLRLIDAVAELIPNRVTATATYIECHYQDVLRAMFITQEHPLFYNRSIGRPCYGQASILFPKIRERRLRWI
jgi:hypothetical protein